MTCEILFLLIHTFGFQAAAPFDIQRCTHLWPGGMEIEPDEQFHSCVIKPGNKRLCVPSVDKILQVREG